MSFRLGAASAAAAAVMLLATEASACSCGTSSAKEQFTSADLVVKGRMKVVTFGMIELPFTKREDAASRVIPMTRGEFEIERLLKGNLAEKTVAIYTGAGLGDCGRLSEFLNAAYYYQDEERGVIELGLMKSENGGKTFYVTTICDYGKGWKGAGE